VFTRGDIPALAESLLGLAQGVIAGRWPVTDAPHRDLCATCPGRRAMCSHPEARTLAPAPPAAPPGEASATSGRGG
jgi:hypothetical protein